ncbi:MAG: T9SS type A sorting domain-containing protein [Prevotellaceae bacterium]|jgi:hypothetical protein|nr:T9SS type A sorting domain-containing protein [Prevotellaceae bacterium]
MKQFIYFSRWLIVLATVFLLQANVAAAQTVDVVIPGCFRLDYPNPSPIVTNYTFKIIGADWTNCSSVLLKYRNTGANPLGLSGAGMSLSCNQDVFSVTPNGNQYQALGTGDYYIEITYADNSIKEIDFSVTLEDADLYAIAVPANNASVACGDTYDFDAEWHLDPGLEVTWTASSTDAKALGGACLSEFPTSGSVTTSSQTIGAYTFYTLAESSGSVVITYTIKSLDFPCLDPVSGTQTLTIGACTQLTLDLTTVSETICYEDSFTPVTLDVSSNAENIPACDIKYEITFSNTGQDVLGISGSTVIVYPPSNTSAAATWTPPTMAGSTGTGVYTIYAVRAESGSSSSSVTATFQRHKSWSDYFSVLSGIDLSSAEYCGNSSVTLTAPDFSSQLSFDSETVEFSWNINSPDDIGLGTTGSGGATTTGPEGTITNSNTSTLAHQVAEITAHFEYANSPKCGYDSVYSITALYDLTEIGSSSESVTAVASGIYCVGETISAAYTPDLNAIPDAEFTWTVSGDVEALGFPTGTTGGSTTLPVLTAANLSTTASASVTISYIFTYPSNPSCTHTVTRNYAIRPDLEQAISTISLPLGDTVCVGTDLAYAPTVTNIAGIDVIFEWNVSNSNGVLFPTSGTGTIPSQLASNASTSYIRDDVTYTFKYDNTNASECEISIDTSIIVRPQLENVIDMSGIPTSASTVCHGASITTAPVPTTLFAGTQITWQADAYYAILNLATTSDVGAIPALKGVNKGTTDQTASLSYTLSYISDNACSYTNGGVSITVRPDIEENIQSVVSSTPLPSGTYCVGNSFGADYISLNTGGAYSKVFSWSTVNTDIGLPASGTATILPTDTAKNGTLIDIESQVTYHFEYNDGGKACGYDSTVKITVHPDLRNVAAIPLQSSGTYCYDQVAMVDPYDPITAANYPTSPVPTFEWAITHNDIFANSVLAAGTNTAIPPLTIASSYTMVETATVSGTFSYSGSPACSHTFTKTLSIRPQITKALESKIAASLLDEDYCNGEPSVNIADFGPNEKIDHVEYDFSWTVQNPAIGLSNGSGTRYPVTLVNTTTADIVSAITYTFKWTDGKGENACEETVVRKITVHPCLLKALPVTSQTICADGAIDSILFTAAMQDKYGKWDTLVPPVAGSVNFTVTHESGDYILDLGSNSVDGQTKWGPVTLPGAYGKGVYKVTPANPGAGIPAYFSLEVRAPLDSIIHLADQTYRNGDVVPALNLNALIPSGTTIEWTNDSPGIGLAPSGTGYIPSFVASNGTDADSTARIAYTLRYTSGLPCVALDTFDITVHPYVVADPNLSVDTVVSQAICANGTFSDIVFAPYYAQTVDPVFDPADVTYKVSFVSGTDVIDWTTDPANIVGWFSSSWNIANAKADSVEGVGIYRVTPRWKNSEGQSTLFTLRVRPNLDGIAGFLDATYNNGDLIQSINLNELAPDGVSIKWEQTNSVNIGLQGSFGVGLIPAFTATNTGIADSTAEITYTMWYTDGKECKVTDRRTITVRPRTLDDLDLRADTVTSQAICEETGGSSFTPITFSVLYQGLEQTDASYIVEFVDGTNIVTLSSTTVSVSAPWSPATVTVGKGTYRVTPYWHNKKGQSTIFTLEIRPLLENVIAIPDVTYRNGDFVPAVNLQALVPAGVTVTWGNNNTGIGLPSNGIGLIPAFTATDTSDAALIATITDTLSYIGSSCTATITHTITVTPHIIADLDLAADTVTSQAICETEEFAAITFTALYHGTEQIDATYIVEFVDGTNIVTLSSTTVSVSAPWSPTTVTVGKGTYRVTPYYNNKQGQSTIFTLEVRPSLEGLVSIPDVTYRNGDFVPAVNLQALVPAGVTVTWGNNNTGIGLPSNGIGLIPAFTATDTSDFALVATITDTLSYIGSSCTATITHTITVTPHTISDLDLVADQVPSQTICYGDLNTFNFDDITFSATYTQQGVTIDQDDVEYIVEFVGGTNILDLTDYIISGSALPWEPVIIAGASGKGTYRVTPRWQNNEGKSAIFTLERLSSLDSASLAIDTLRYVNGDYVPAYTFTGIDIPEGASIEWKWLATSDNIGSTSFGADRIPAFTAVNTTSDTLYAEYEVSLSSGACSAVAAADTLVIVVAPRTVDNWDLAVVPVLDQTICHDGKFTPITLTATYRFNADFNDVVEFQWELIEGSDTLGLGNTIGVVGDTDNEYTWTLPASTLTGSATFRVIPIWNNNKGVSTVFTLTRLPEPTVDPVSSIVECNNSELPAIQFTGSANTTFKWQVVDATDSPEASALGLQDNGESLITLPRLVNTGTATRTEYIKVTPTITTDGLVCEGTAQTFSISVLPTPVANPISNILANVGTKVLDIDLLGTATNYRWVIHNPAILADPVGYPTTGVTTPANHVIPEFTTENYSDLPIQSLVTVTPIYTDNGLTCEGAPITFYILVAPALSIDPIGNITVCEDEDTDPIVPIGLPSGNGYYIDWTNSNPAIGLASSNTAGTHPRSVPGLHPATISASSLSTPTEATITITPTLTYGGNTYTGASESFIITVIPKVRLNPTYGELDAPKELEYCQGESTTGDLFVGATGYNLRYQWYKDGSIVPGADKATYTIDKVDTYHTGRYHVIVSGDCGALKSVFYNVLIKPEVLSQRWNDMLVVNTDEATNGGYKFSNIQWYKNNVLVVGEDLTYLYDANLDPNAVYHIVAETQYGTFVSCGFSPTVITSEGISVYPNPVKSGEVITITGAATVRSIRLYSILGEFLESATPADEVKIRMPNATGIYLIQINIDNTRTKTFTVITGN